MRVVFGCSQVGLLHCQVPEQRNPLEGSVTLPGSHSMVVCSCSNTAKLRGASWEPKNLPPQLRASSVLIACSEVMGENNTYLSSQICLFVRINGYKMLHRHLAVLLLFDDIQVTF